MWLDGFGAYLSFPDHFGIKWPIRTTADPCRAGGWNVSQLHGAALQLSISLLLV